MNQQLHTFKSLTIRKPYSWEPEYSDGILIATVEIHGPRSEVKTDLSVELGARIMQLCMDEICSGVEATTTQLVKELRASTVPALEARVDRE